MVNGRWSMVDGRKGFTIVELLLYMGLLAFVLLILTQMLISVLNVRLESSASSGIQIEGNYLLSKFYYDINQATSIDLPATPGAQTTNLMIIKDGISNSYSESSGKLILTNNFGTNELNSFHSNISNLSFLRLGKVGGKNTVTVSFTLTSTTQRETGPEIRNFQTSVGLR